MIWRENATFDTIVFGALVRMRGSYYIYLSPSSKGGYADCVDINKQFCYTVKKVKYPEPGERVYSLDLMNEKLPNGGLIELGQQLCMHMDNLTEM